MTVLAVVRPSERASRITTVPLVPSPDFQAAADAGGITYAAPEGLVTVDGPSQHVYKTARIGKIGSDGLIKEVWSSGQPIKPDPYLQDYSWATGLA